MTSLADFVERERASILGSFLVRVREKGEARSMSNAQLLDDLPAFFDELLATLRHQAEPAKLLLGRSHSAEAHGLQRLLSGYDLEAMVHEYGIVRDCIYERLEQLSYVPSLRELRIMGDAFGAAESNAVRRFVQTQNASSSPEHLRLLSAFNGAPGFVALLNGPEHVFELANAAYLQLVGHRQVLGKRVRDALPEVATQGFLELLDTVYRSGQPFLGKNVTVALQGRPGGPLRDAYVDFVYQPLFSAEGDVAGILVQGHDVTAMQQSEQLRLAAEEAVRASEERLRNVFENIDDGYSLIEMLFDANDEPIDYRFLEVNRSFERHTGLVGATGRLARELVPELDASWLRLYGGVAKTGQPAKFENHEPAMDGRWFEVFANRVGRPEQHHVALVFKDVSARMRLSLERERRLELETAARESAEEAGRLKDEFLATLSHELRTPLHSMAGWVHILQTGNLPPERRERALATIARNVSAQAQLIDDLLDVSRILAGKMRLEVVPLNVQTVVEAALETVRPAAEAKSIRLQTTLASDCAVMGDPGRLQQVIWNLLSNALKFTPKGGRVQVVLSCHESAAEILVSDTGKGIEPSFLPHVFERFRQESGGASRSQGGLGLGLSIVRQLVELHGGTVHAESEGEGRGSSFKIRLPLAILQRVGPRASPVAELAPAAGSVAELLGVHVALVDDDADAREMLQLTLEQCGARVRSAASAAELMRLLESEVPDVIVSDIGMPDEDGYALIRRIRALPPEKGGTCAAVALTAYARTQDRTSALLAGFNNHVTKPVDANELFAVIASLAGRARRTP
jgi:signal transduction histidine kinase/CheY-like chemotaxis protein